jgi:hypothetical protein
MKQDKKRRNCVDCGGALAQVPGKGRPLLRCDSCRAEDHRTRERRRYRRSPGVGTLAKSRGQDISGGPAAEFRGAGTVDGVTRKKSDGE